MKDPKLNETLHLRLFEGTKAEMSVAARQARMSRPEWLRSVIRAALRASRREMA